MKILFASSEVAPFCKTGGLGEVAGTLATVLQREGHDVRVFLPKYREINTTQFALKPRPEFITLRVGDNRFGVRLWEGRLARQVPAYFVDSPHHFDREGLYRDSRGNDYPDNGGRFILFNRAVLAGAQALGFQPDIVHAHDWQAGLLPAYLATTHRSDPFFEKTGSVFSIHNIAYQGLFYKDTLALAGFGWDLFTPGRFEFYGGFSFLKAALVSADVITTVSPRYAREVQSGAEFGRGMEGVLTSRADRFIGVLNGIDNHQWNPATDSHIAQTFGPRSLAKRAANRADLLKWAGLKDDPRAPVFGMVSRLDPQKGFDVLLDILETFLESGARAVFLGQGSVTYEMALRTLAHKFPDRLALFTDFNEELAHQIYAGVDMFLMPSRFEPCGLGQMIAQRYGAVPVVTATGGLADTVPPVNKDASAGVGFVAPRAQAGDFRRALNDAVTVWRDHPALWKKIMTRGMAARFEWTQSVERYLDLYRLAHRDRSTGTNDF